MNHTEVIGAIKTGREGRKSDILHTCNRFVIACMRNDLYQEIESMTQYKKLLPPQKEGKKTIKKRK